MLLIKKMFEYKCLPIYKYLIFLLLLYMFIKHQNIISDTQLLTNALMAVTFIILLDNIIIEDHPAIVSLDMDDDETVEKFNEEENTEKSESDTSDEDNIVDFEKNEE